MSEAYIFPSVTGMVGSTSAGSAGDVDDYLAEADKQLQLNVPFKLHRVAKAAAKANGRILQYILRAIIDKVRRVPDGYIPRI